MAAEAKRAVRPHPQQMVKCPRCNSCETKFCYYNNYSTTQPRYFCKNCKRYWTDGGTLRNVPVGGGLRKNKRSKTKLAASSSSSPPASSTLQQKPSASTPTMNVNHSTTASHLGLSNPSPDANHGLPHTPGYLVFNPRNYETDNQAASITGQLPLYQQEVNYTHHIVPPPPLPMLAGGQKQHIEPTLSAAPYYSLYPWHPKDHDRALPESLQAGGFHHSSENSGVNYSMSNLVNVNDWQHISEGLFGTGGESNYMFMQPPQPPQWADFDAGTRL